MAADKPLTAYALNCSLKPSSADEKSSTDRMLTEILAALKKHGVTSKPPVRVLDNDVKPGVLSDMGEGDDWPMLREQIVAADIFVLGLPIWMGQPSSVAKRVLERLDAFLGETDERGRMPAAGKVALATRTALMPAMPPASSRSMTSALPSRPMPASIGSARPWAASILST